MNTIIAAALAALMTAHGANAAEISARKALISVMNAVGADCENTEIAEITEENAFLLGLDGAFEGVLSAAMTLEASADGEGKFVVVCDGGKTSKKIYEHIVKHYEFPACDNADRAAVLRAGNIVAHFKGTAADVSAYCRAFGEKYGTGGVKIIKNPEKMR